MPTCPPLESMGKFATVVIDPPWPIQWSDAYSAKATYRRMSYDTMSLDEIKALPVQSILMDHAFVYCWTTVKFLRSAFECLDAWGLEYIYTMAWHKAGGPSPVTAPIYNLEPILVGRQGMPKYRTTKGLFLCNSWPYFVDVGSHSAKPEAFYDLLRRVTHGPRLDIFNRRRIKGFRGWGYEAPPDRPADPDEYQEVLI